MSEGISSFGRFLDKEMGGKSKDVDMDAAAVLCGEARNADMMN